MALVYTPPGISFSEIVSNTVSSLLSAPAQPCIIAPAQGYITRTDPVILSGTGEIPLPNLPTGAKVTTVVSVKDASDPTKGATDGSGYVITTDWTANTSDGTVSRVSTGAIASGTLVNVTYQYVSSQYYSPIRLSDLNSIEQRFGPSFTSDGTQINSILSYAANIAFQNGAPSVVCQPLFIRQTPGDYTTAPTQPNATQVGSAAAWSDTLYGLRDYEDIDLIVPAIGQTWNNNGISDNTQLAILQACQDHSVWMKTQNSYIITLAGEDSTGGAASESTLQAHATTLAGRYGGAFAEQFVLVTPASFQTLLPYTGNPINVGGQYVAAALAGMLSSYETFTPLTRQQIAGFTAVNTTQTLGQKNADAAAGLLVIEQNNVGTVQVRHAITLDTSVSARRELSVVRSKHRMIESVRSTLDSQIIGQITADANAPFIVASAVIGSLEQLKSAGELVDYSDVAVNFTSLDPTTLQVRFSYQPSFPVNYINIVFSLDLTGGSSTSANPGANG